MNDLRLTVNGEPRAAAPGTTVAGLLAGDGHRPGARRGRAEPGRRPPQDLGRGGAGRRRPDRDRRVRGRRLGWRPDERGSTTADDPLVIGGRKFNSRLLVGTGKYRTLEEGREAIRRSGAEIVTVALRRVDLTPGKPNVLDTIDRTRHTILPNTAGCYTAEEAIRTCRLARELGMADLVKLEVIGDQQTLFPDGAATLEAARVLVKEGFTVLPYCMDDPILAKKLEDVGCAAVMPLAAPIGSGLGIRNPYNLRIILEQRQGADHRRRRRRHGLRRGGGDGARLRTACS